MLLGDRIDRIIYTLIPRLQRALRDFPSSGSDDGARRSKRYYVCEWCRVVSRGDAFDAASLAIAASNLFPVS